MSQAAQDAAWFRVTLDQVKSETAKAVIGQDDVVEGVLVSLAANGHVLLEGMPGLGKTLLVRTLSQALTLPFSRIQFTPDMMPADVTGTTVLSQDAAGTRSFEYRRGPLFASLVLADEINRATPKTQSALLEAMQERSVTAGGTRHTLPEPFLVMATQNPIEQEGTYPLPEAQLDRFFFKVLVPYPTKEELAQVVMRTTAGDDPVIQAVAGPEDVIRLRRIVREVPVSSPVMNLALSLVVGTHPEGEGATAASRKWCRCGASPRGAQAIVTAAKAYALRDGRYNVSQDDILKAALPSLRHRIILNFEAEAEGLTPDAVLAQVIQQVTAASQDPIKV
jgi:MoxR-like ATPase